jgi:hypothetical protein
MVLQEAMRAAEKVSTEECPVKMKLVAPPLYVLTTIVRALSAGSRTRMGSTLHTPCWLSGGYLSVFTSCHSQQRATIQACPCSLVRARRLFFFAAIWNVHKDGGVEDSTTDARTDAGAAEGN